MHVLETLREDTKPSILRASDLQDLAVALESSEHGLHTLVAVPVRSPQRLLGIALLYFPHDAPVPSAATLDHLHLLSRLLRAPLELAIERGVA
jgi:GAF domain-containing protein